MKTQRMIVVAIAVALGSSLSGCQPTPVKSSDQASASSKPVEKQQAEVRKVEDQQVENTPAEAKKPAEQNAQSLAAKSPAVTGYDNAKGDFSYGPGQAWPTLVVPPELTPGPLAAIPAPAPVVIGAAAANPADGSPVETAHQQGPCASELSASSLDLGPKDAWLSTQLKSAAMGALGRALFGSFGGGDDIDESDAPPTVSDPIPKSARQAFHDQLSDTEMTISGRLNDEGLLLSTDIDSAPDKSTFHAIYIERKDCKRIFPDRYLNYRMWVEWSLSVSWTKTESHYQNDSLVSEQTSSGGFHKSGEFDLAKGSINMADAKALGEYQQGLLSDLPPPIWQQMGFSSPSSGVRGLGSQFDQVDSAKLFDGSSVAVVHVTRVVDGRYVTRALPFRMEQGSGDLLKFSRL